MSCHFTVGIRKTISYLQPFIPQIDLRKSLLELDNTCRSKKFSSDVGIEAEALDIPGVFINQGQYLATKFNYLITVGQRCCSELNYKVILDSYLF